LRVGAGREGGPREEEEREGRDEGEPSGRRARPRQRLRRGHRIGRGLQHRPAAVAGGRRAAQERERGESNRSGEIEGDSYEMSMSFRHEPQLLSFE